MLVAGVDSSTQSTKVLLCESADGKVVAEASAPHPPGTECDPEDWWAALRRAGEGLLEQAAAVAVAGQQHGMVVLDDDGTVIRPALLWNDLRSAAASADLIAESGGRAWWAEHTGSVPNASFTVAKLRWLAEQEPARAAAVARVMLPHDWLTWRLGATEPVTDRGDASGTGYFGTPGGEWLPGVVAAALGHQPELPRVAEPGEAVGQTAGGALLAPGTGDNMAAALGLGLEAGELAVSVGTSGTVFAVSEEPPCDPSGAVAGFADATGRFLPLVCTVNAGLVLSASAVMTGTDLAGLAERALSAEPGAAGITLLPYFDGERTPERPLATGVLAGLTTANAMPHNLARASVEGVLASLADAADRLAACGVEAGRVLMIGGGARSEAMRVVAPTIFGCDVDVPEPREYVALGAARQAAWALAGTPEPPDWPRPPGMRYRGVPHPEIRARYAALRDATVPWDGARRDKRGLTP
jgi:xylulokinase